MAVNEVDDLHQTLMQFAQRTNDLVCSANSKLERLVNSHTPEMIAAADEILASTSSSEPMLMSSVERTSKRARLGFFRLFADPSKQEAPSPYPILPVEILDNIFQLLTQHQLRPLLFANSFMYRVARRRIYHTIVIDSPLQTISFLKNILSNPELPPLVRSLEICISQIKRRTKIVSDSDSTAGNPSASTDPVLAPPPQFTFNFYSLLNRALCAMHSLLSLSIELPKSHSPIWIFSGCTFKLRQFTTSMHCHRSLADFLERQESVEELTLRGFQTESLLFLPFLGAAAASLVQMAGVAVNPAESGGSGGSSPLSFALSPTALPHLKSFNAIHAGPSIIHTIMKGRSVEVASIPLFPEHGIPTLNALGSGKAPLKRLSVISFDPGAPEFLFEELAMRFKDLEALHLVMLMADYSHVSTTFRVLNPPSKKERCDSLSYLLLLLFFRVSWKILGDYCQTLLL